MLNCQSYYNFLEAVLGSGFWFWVLDIRRAARSGLDLVAEGYYRFNPREFHRFLDDAKASLGEVRNQLMHAKDERFIADEEFRELSTLANRAIGAANALQKYLRSCQSKFAQRPKPRAKAGHDEPATNEDPGTKQEPRTENRQINIPPVLSTLSGAFEREGDTAETPSVDGCRHEADSATMPLADFAGTALSSHRCATCWTRKSSTASRSPRAACASRSR